VLAGVRKPVGGAFGAFGCWVRFAMTTIVRWLAIGTALLAITACAFVFFARLLPPDWEGWASWLAIGVASLVACANHLLGIAAKIECCVQDWLQSRRATKRIAAHLRAILAYEAYERWSDARYVDERARPLPMKVSACDPISTLATLNGPSVDLLQAMETAGSRIAILGDPGSGKTTALERLMWVTAKRGLEEPRKRLIPIFVPLSDYGQHSDLPALLRAGLNKVGVLSYSLEEVEAVLARQRCFVLMDGLNEMGRFTEEGLKAVSNLMDTYPGHRYCLTCRSEDYRDFQARISGVRGFVIQELDEDDVEGYLLQHLGRLRGASLFAEVRCDARLRSMARIPLLLYMIKEAGLPGALPTDRGGLIAGFVKSPRILGRIAESQIRRKAFPTLAALACAMQEERTLVCQVDVALGVVRECVGDEEYSAATMFGELKKTGLLVPVGDQRVRMLHQMLQEYFAGEALAAKPYGRDRMNALANDDWWREAVVMYAWLTADTESLVQLIVEPGLHGRIRRAAGEALAGSGASAVEMLMAKLVGQDTGLRERAAWALVKVGQPGVGKLVESLGHPDANVRQLASWALVRIGNPAVQRLKRALKDPQRRVRDGAAWTLVSIGERAVPPLIVSLTGTDADLRRAASWTLARIGGPAVSPLVELLTHVDAVARTSAATILGEIDDTRAVSPLMKMLNDNSAGVRAAAAEALGRMGSVGALEPLIQLLHDEGPLVRIQAARALGWMADSGSVHHVAETLGDDQPPVRAAAAEALGRIGDAEAVEPLIDVLADEDANVRENASRALGWIGDARAAHFLIGRLWDDSWAVRASAAEALGRIGDAEAVAPLIELLRDRDPRVSEKAASALRRIGEPAVGPLAEAFRHERPTRVVTALSAPVPQRHGLEPARLEHGGQAGERLEGMRRSTTVTGKGFYYTGSLSGGLTVYPTDDQGMHRSGGVVPIPAHGVDFIREEISKAHSIPMGACRDNPRPGSLGRRLLEWGRSPQWLSYVVPLLAEEGFCEFYKEGRRYIVRHRGP
jgi:HEAT repeat protein